MLFLTNLFGRSREVNRLEDAFRAAGVHPRLVPDAVVMATINLLKGGDQRIDGEACGYAADLLALCMLGTPAFTDARGPADATATEARLEAALVIGDGLDAELVLLAHHAALIHPGILKAFEIGTS